ncbi:MAG: hypothetical protein AAGC93_29310 [Cyanobacteria bacterium P01_F01_bin.53]
MKKVNQDVQAVAFSPNDIDFQRLKLAFSRLRETGAALGFVIGVSEKCLTKRWHSDELKVLLQVFGGA